MVSFQRRFAVQIIGVVELYAGGRTAESRLAQARVIGAVSLLPAISHLKNFAVEPKQVIRSNHPFVIRKLGGAVKLVERVVVSGVAIGPFGGGSRP